MDKLRFAWQSDFTDGATCNKKGAVLQALPEVHGNFLKYYKRLVHDGGGRVPPRISVRPADIKPMLPWTVLAERDGPGHLVPTVIGSAVDDILRVSLTGLNLFDHWSEELGAQMDEFYSSITDTPCGGFMVRSLETSGGLLKDYISSLFPLVGASGKVDRVFGLISVSKEEPLLASFGKPEDIETSVTDMSFIDIGFGVP